MENLRPRMKCNHAVMDSLKMKKDIAECQTVIMSPTVLRSRIPVEYAAATAHLVRTVLA
jgi:hypothetical protein